MRWTISCILKAVLRRCRKALPRTRALRVRDELGFGALRTRLWAGSETKTTATLFLSLLLFARSSCIVVAVLVVYRKEIGQGKLDKGKAIKASFSCLRMRVNVE